MLARLATLSLALLAGTAILPTPAAAVIGGRKSSSTATPFAAYVAHELAPGQVEVCSGTVLAPTVVVTAAHCLLDEDTHQLHDPSEYQVTVGRDTVTGDGGETLRVREVRLHPDFQERRLFPDLGVLILAQEAHVPAIRLPAGGDATEWRAGAPATLAGWGKWRERQRVATEHLRSVGVRVRSRAFCFDKLGDDYAGTYMLCASGAGHAPVGACAGDSGGPLAVRDHAGGWVLAGIVSWGVTPCGSAPTVFARISAVVWWLRRQLPPATAVAAPA
jgi:secreted trypsin-like serine protease